MTGEYNLTMQTDSCFKSSYSEAEFPCQYTNQIVSNASLVIVIFGINLEIASTVIFRALAFSFAVVFVAPSLDR
jgi:hypothetical protein